MTQNTLRDILPGDSIETKNIQGFWIRAAFTLKLFLIGFLILLFFIPMMMVNDIISDRQNYRMEAVDSVSQGWAEQQSFFGPVLVVPYTHIYTTQEKDITGKIIIKTYKQEKKHYVFPKILDVKADIQTQERKRGLYGVPVYTAQIQAKGSFIYPHDLFAQNKTFVPHDPYITLGIDDIRGLGQNIDFRVEDQNLTAQAGTQLDKLRTGIHFPFKKTNMPTVNNFTLSFSLKGTQTFSFMPTADQASLSVVSSWPSPSFTGAFLPSTSHINDKGFTAKWETNFLATDVLTKFLECIDHNCVEFSSTVFSVDLFQSVDIYQQTERAVKYALLFIVLVFGTFLVFEALQSTRIHPAQYILVGGALCVFYLILLALSEHMDFILAYILATLAIAGLLGYYVAYVLGSVRHGVALGSTVAALYGALFFILRSEDYALLVGTGLLFAVLAAAMVATRKLDWYAIGSRNTQ